MKNLLYVSIVVTIASCAKPSAKQMNLIGEIEGLKKGTVILQKVVDTTLVSVDSVQVNGISTFSFSEEIESPEVFYIYLRKDGSLSEDRISFFAEPGEITINTSLKSFGLDVVINGSVNQEKFVEYQKVMKRYTDKNLSLIEESFKAQKDGKDSLADALKTQQNRLLASKYLATVNYALSHTDLEIAPYLMLTEVYDANIKYLDTVHNSLTPNIKESKYGKALETFIKNRKE